MTKRKRIELEFFELNSDDTERAQKLVEQYRGRFFILISDFPLKHSESALFEWYKYLVIQLLIKERSLTLSFTLIYLKGQIDIYDEKLFVEAYREVKSQFR